MERQPGDEPADGQEREPGDDGDEGDQPGNAPHLPLERARLDLHPLGESGDPSQLGLHPGREHECGRGAANAARAAEDDVARVEERASCAVQLRRTQDRLRLSGQGREVDFDRPFEQACVRRDPLSLLYEENVSGDEVAASTTCLRPSLRTPACCGR